MGEGGREGGREGRRDEGAISRVLTLPFFLFLTTHRHSIGKKKKEGGREGGREGERDKSKHSDFTSFSSFPTTVGPAHFFGPRCQ